MFSFFQMPIRTNPFMPNPFGLPNIPNTGGTGLSKPNMPWPGVGSAGPAFPSSNGVGSSTRWGSTGTGVIGSLNTAVGGTGTLSGGLGSTGLGGPGSTRTGLAQTGTSSLGGVGPGLTGVGSAGSSGVGMGKPVVGGAGVGSLGSNTPGFGATLAGTRTPTGGSDVSQGIPSRSGITLHFLIRFYSHFFVPIFIMPNLLCLIYSTDQSSFEGAASLFTPKLREWTKSWQTSQPELSITVWK